MQSRFFWLTSCYILTATIVRQDVVDSLDTDEPNLFTLHDDDTSSSSLYINPDFGTADDDLWSSDTTNLIDADNTGLFLDDDNDDIIASCSSSGNTDTLTRRADDGKTCTSPQKPEDETPPDVKFRPLRTTKDLPISIPTYNLEICDALTMGIFRTIVACDSGREEDRKTTTDAGVYVLQHCTPFDILRGCRSPHEIWCCTDLTPEIDADELRHLYLNVGAQFNLLLNQFELIPGYWAGGCKRLDPALPNWDSAPDAPPRPQLV